VRIGAGQTGVLRAEHRQVEQQLANNKRERRRQFRGSRLQQINVRALGHVKSVRDIEDTVVKTQGGTAVRIKDIGTWCRAPRSAWARSGRRFHRADGKIVDNGDVVEGSWLLRKGANSDSTLDAIHDKVKELNEHIPASGGEGCSVSRPQRPGSPHNSHGAPQPDRKAFCWWRWILFMFLGNGRGALIVALTIPFSFAVCVHLSQLIHVPANLLSLGALDFGMGGGKARW